VALNGLRCRTSNDCCGRGNSDVLTLAYNSALIFDFPRILRASCRFRIVLGNDCLRALRCAKRTEPGPRERVPWTTARPRAGMLSASRHPSLRGILPHSGRWYWRRACGRIFAYCRFRAACSPECTQAGGTGA